MQIKADLSNDDDLESIRRIHDNEGGPRAAYAWAIGRERETIYSIFSGETWKDYFTEDLDTDKVTDFIIDFYNAYNKRFGLTY